MIITRWWWVVNKLNNFPVYQICFIGHTHTHSKYCYFGILLAGTGTFMLIFCFGNVPDDDVWLNIINNCLVSLRFILKFSYIWENFQHVRDAWKIHTQSINMIEHENSFICTKNFRIFDISFEKYFENSCVTFSMFALLLASNLNRHLKWVCVCNSCMYIIWNLSKICQKTNFMVLAIYINIFQNIQQCTVMNRAI